METPSSSNLSLMLRRSSPHERKYSLMGTHALVVEPEVLEGEDQEDPTSDPRTLLQSPSAQRGCRLGEEVAHLPRSRPPGPDCVQRPGGEKDKRTKKTKRALSASKRAMKMGLTQQTAACFDHLRRRPDKTS